MKRQILLTIAFSVLAANAFATDCSDTLKPTLRLQACKQLEQTASRPMAPII